MESRKTQFNIVYRISGIEKDYDAIQALDSIRKELGFEAMCILSYTRLGVPDYTAFIGINDREADLLANDRWSRWLSNTGRWKLMADYDSCMIEIESRDEALSYNGYYDYVDDTEIYTVEAVDNG